MWLAIRYRPVQGLMLVALAALITTCAVLAPLYDRAMQQALTRQTIDGAPSNVTAIHLSSLSRFTSGVDPGSYLAATSKALATLLPRPAGSWFLPAIDATSLLVTQEARTSTSPVGELLWRDGACGHVTWAAGACPQASGDVAISGADAKNFGLQVGSMTVVLEQPQVQTNDQLPPVRLRVTGIYRQIPGLYWDGRELTGLSGVLDPDPPNQPLHDTWLTAPGTFTGSQAPSWLDPTNSVDFNLDRGHVGVDRARQLGPLATGVIASAALPLANDGAGLDDPSAILAQVQSGLPGISATIDEGRRQALITVPLLMIQLGLLALFVLWLVLGAAVAERRPEVAVARLRGAGTAGARRMILAELLPVVLAGVPVGTALALGLTDLARRVVLDGHAPFELGRAFALSVAGSVVLLVAASWLSTQRGTRDPISALLRSVPTRAHGWAIGAGDAAVITACGTAVLAFVSGDLAGPFALAAPALLALIVGLLLAHLIVPGATSLGRRLLARGRYGAGVGLLAMARRPATRRAVAVITVASALLVFSADAITVAARNRQLAAERDTGAPMVADLVGTDVTHVQAALASVGDGHETPVVPIGPTGKASLTTLAVVPSAFPHIALFPGIDAQGVPWTHLIEATGRRLQLTGRTISVLVTPQRLSVSQRAGVFLQLELLDRAGSQTSVQVGTIPVSGPRTLTASVPCASGCTVAGLTIRSYPGVTYSGHIAISAVKAPGGSTNLPGAVADWSSGKIAGQVDLVEPSAATPGSLTVHLISSGQGPLGMTSRWLPATVPAVLAGPGNDTRARTIGGNGLDGTDRSLVSVGLLTTAPGHAGPVALVDLDLLQHWGAQVAGSSGIQVWFDSENPARLARVTAALQRQGIDVRDVRRVSQVRHGFDTSVPAWSLQLGVLAAVAGLLIAALVLVLLVVSTWRLRSRDLACLRMSGVPRRGLSRIARAEQLPVVVLAVLAGAGCGLLGAKFALPTVPLFALARPASTLDLSTSWATSLAVLAIEAVVLILVGLRSGRAIVARAQLTRLRDAR